MPGVSWIYELHKEQLENELRRLGLNPVGAVAALRQRLVTFVRAHPQMFEEKPTDPPEYKEDMDRTKDMEALQEELNRLQPATSSPRPPTSTAAEENANTTQTENQTLPPHRLQQLNLRERMDDFEPTAPSTGILDQMRKWNYHFDGKNVYGRLERLKEPQRAYKYTDNQILRGFPELLKRDAQLWYRNCATEINSFPELEQSLRRFYLPPSELRQLDQQIYNRHQGSNEAIRDYVTSLLTLTRRRGGFSQEKTMENLYYNMKPGLRLFIRRTDVNTPDELIRRVEEIQKALNQQEKESRSEHKVSFIPFRQQTANVSPAYDPQTACWRCKGKGHTRRFCQNKPKKFCSQCGKDGVLTKECPCQKQGNEKGAGPN